MDFLIYYYLLIPYSISEIYMVVVDYNHNVSPDYMEQTVIHPCHKLYHPVADSQRSSSLDCSWVNHRMLNNNKNLCFYIEDVFVWIIRSIDYNLHFKKRVDSSTQYWKLSGFEASYQTKVLSRFTSGGIGRKPNP